MENIGAGAAVSPRVDRPSLSRGRHRGRLRGHPFWRTRTGIRQFPLAPGAERCLSVDVVVPIDAREGLPADRGGRCHQPGSTSAPGREQQHRVPRPRDLTAGTDFADLRGQRCQRRRPPRPWRTRRTSLVGWTVTNAGGRGRPGDRAGPTGLGLHGTRSSATAHHYILAPRRSGTPPRAGRELCGDPSRSPLPPGVHSTGCGSTSRRDTTERGVRGRGARGRPTTVWPRRRFRGHRRTSPMADLLWLARRQYVQRVVAVWGFRARRSRLTWRVRETAGLGRRRNRPTGAGSTRSSSRATSPDRHGGVDRQPPRAFEQLGGSGRGRRSLTMGARKGCSRAGRSVMPRREFSGPIFAFAPGPPATGVQTGFEFVLYAEQPATDGGIARGGDAGALAGPEGVAGHRSATETGATEGGVLWGYRSGGSVVTMGPRRGGRDREAAPWRDPGVPLLVPLGGRPRQKTPVRSMLRRFQRPPRQGSHARCPKEERVGPTSGNRAAIPAAPTKASAGAYRCPWS